MFENIYLDRLKQYLTSIDFKIAEELEKIVRGESKNTTNLKNLEISKENILERIAETKNAQNHQEPASIDLEHQLGIFLDEVVLVEGKSKKIAIPQTKVSEDRLPTEVYNLNQAVNAVKNQVRTSMEIDKMASDAIAVLRVLENQTLIDDVKNFINNKHANAMFSVFIIFDKFYKSYKAMKSEESTNTASTIKYTMNLILSYLEDMGYQTEPGYDGPIAIYATTLLRKDRALIMNEQIKGFVVRTKPSQEVQVLASANDKFIIVTSKNFADFKRENWNK